MLVPATAAVPLRKFLRSMLPLTYRVVMLPSSTGVDDTYKALAKDTKVVRKHLQTASFACMQRLSHNVSEGMPAQASAVRCLS